MLATRKSGVGKPSTTTKMSDNAVSASAKGASFLILLQIGSRALTFALNQILLRFLSPELLGVNVQLELYCISVLYFARESLRVALQRRADGTQTVINMSYLAILAGLPLSYALAELYLQTEVPKVPFLVQSLRVYGGAAMVELLAEPSFVAAQQKMLYKVRAGAEAAATIMKTFATVGLVVWASRQGRDLGVLPFAVGQLAYAASLLVVYSARLVLVAKSEGFSLLPRAIQSKTEKFWLSLFSQPLLNLSLSLTVQSSIKYVLTQGDSLLIASLASLQDQGAYALSSNYGGLIARMLFQPIEEASRNLFAKLCAPTSAAEKTKERQASGNGIAQANTTLTLILKFYSLISLVAFAAGPTAAPVLLSLVAGSRWSDTGAGEVLGCYCYYIPLLALNGVSEAFVAAVADNTQLYTQSIWMGGFFAAFAGSAYLFLRVLEMGAKGLVWANCVNMGCRILFNLSFVKSFFAKRGQAFDVTKILPSAVSIAVAAVVPSIFKATTGLLSRYGIIGELARIGAITGLFVLVLAVSERKFLVHVYKQIRP
ncbi:oligosaccharide translocation protein RFT1 [Aureobasidium pullulans]|uniref:Man(5)GlcNAc(2)-PP-dolichol translocation protein RFT1 n=1 Tax=Aureobasidium pullulans TaxID=5580 RepID=A0A4S9EWN0_AURPU|nr:oligosaccharide translocation protein RFT1 [Aureobasidium pullulans]